MVGWYNVPYNLILMVLLTAQSLAVAVFPSLVKEYDSGRGSIQKTVQRVIRYLLLLSLPMAIGGAMLSRQIILTLYGEGYLPSVGLLRGLVWVLPLLFLAEILGRTSSTLHLERGIAPLSVVLALLSIGLNVALVPTMGAMGAVIAVLTSQSVRIVVASIIIGPRLLFGGSWVSLLRVAASGAAMGAAVWLVRDSSILISLDDKVGLLVLLAVGAVSYGIAALLFRAITPSEVVYLRGVARRKLRKVLP